MLSAPFLRPLAAITITSGSLSPYETQSFSTKRTLLKLCGQILGREPDRELYYMHYFSGYI